MTGVLERLCQKPSTVRDCGTEVYKVTTTMENCSAHCKSNAYLLLVSSIGCYLSNKKELWEIGIASLDGLNPKIVYPHPIPEYEYMEEFSTKEKLNEAWKTRVSYVWPYDSASSDKRVMFRFALSSFARVHFKMHFRGSRS